MKRLLAVPVLLALAGPAACGGDDDQGGTPARSATGAAGVTDRLFAGSATENRADPDAGTAGGKLTVLSAGDVDYLDPGKTYYIYAMGIITAVHAGSTRTRRTRTSRCPISRTVCRGSPATARPSP